MCHWITMIPFSVDINHMKFDQITHALLSHTNSFFFFETENSWKLSTVFEMIHTHNYSRSNTVYDQFIAVKSGIKFITDHKIYRLLRSTISQLPFIYPFYNVWRSDIFLCLFLAAILSLANFYGEELPQLLRIEYFVFETTIKIIPY